MKGRPVIHPGSPDDRIREACPAGKGATFAQILTVANIRADDLRERLTYLRDVGYIRTSGDKRGMKYFWRRTNRRKTAKRKPVSETVFPQPDFSKGA